LCTNLHIDGVTVCRKSSEGRTSKWVDQLLAVAGGVDLMIRSAVEAKDSIMWVVDFLEGLKDAEADQEGALSSFTALNL
jgi:hypothetical protein